LQGLLKVLSAGQWLAGSPKHTDAALMKPAKTAEYVNIIDLFMAEFIDLLDIGNFESHHR